tara:strand:- start:30 stop:191 length:162 start_codon:yes stop_codon:yes gene_type:complete
MPYPPTRERYANPQKQGGGSGRSRRKWGRRLDIPGAHAAQYTEVEKANIDSRE